METFISVVCNACGKEVKADESVYCSECLDHKNKTLHEQDEKIKALEDKINELENEKERLHEELMEYRT